MNPAAEITTNQPLSDLVDELLIVQPTANNSTDNTNGVDSSELQNLNLNSRALVQIIRSLQTIDNRLTELHTTITQEIGELKKELQDSHKIINEQKSIVEKLQKQNDLLEKKLNDAEMDSRSNKLVLSGSLIKMPRNMTPSQMRNEAIQHIKSVYNYDLPKDNIVDCKRLRGKDDASDDRIILSLDNAFLKSDLMTTVIQKDKRKGVPLNINEYLTSFNANLLYHLRGTRKKYPNKIFSCFSRQGRVYYKRLKNSKPKLIAKMEDINNLTKEGNQPNSINYQRNGPSANANQPTGPSENANQPTGPSDNTRNKVKYRTMDYGRYDSTSQFV